jgi:RHS repeat-associated protein
MMPGSSAGRWSIALPDGSYPVVVVMGDAVSRDQTNTITVNGVELDDPTPAERGPNGYEQGAFDGYATQATVSDGVLAIAPVRGLARDPKLCFVEIGPRGSTIDDATRERVAQTVRRMTAATASRRTRPSVAREFVHGGYVDEPLLMQEGTSARYLHANHLYSIAAVTDASGAVLERYRYDAYGERTVLAPDGVTPRTTSAVGVGRGFTGRDHDAETGLVQFRARMYDASLGRFLGRDPLRYHDGYSQYAAWFVPDGVDPSGMAEVDCSCGCKDMRDLKDQINDMVRKAIAQAKKDGKDPGGEVARQFGGNPVGALEKWAEKQPDKKSVKVGDSKYKGAESAGGVMGAIFNFYGLNSCVLVCGECIGTDKLGHFIAQGREYFDIEKKGAGYGAGYGTWLEGKSTGDKALDQALTDAGVTQGGFGLATTGVFSNADLAANAAGMQMYNDLAAGKDFDICNYVNGKWDEEKNPNEYSPDLDKIVKANQAAAAAAAAAAGATGGKGGKE